MRIYWKVPATVLIPTSILLFLIVATTLVILYARGYRFGISQGQVAFGQTGILVVKSEPNGAQVFINDHLTTATDNTINLSPGTYKVKIYKDGYFAWQKTLSIQKEVVTQADALLFPTSPTSLQTITSFGANNPSIDPTQSRVAFTVASQSAQKNGIYVLDITSRPILMLQSGSTQITSDTDPNTLFSQTTNLRWSPDGKQLLATLKGNGQPYYFLLDASGFNTSPQDVTETIESVKSQWQLELEQKNLAQIRSLPKNLQSYAKSLFSVVGISPDETRILYQASQSATIPFIKQPRLIGLDSTPEERNLEKGSFYVYDIKNDQNFKIPVDKTDENTPLVASVAPEELSLKWFPDSNHLIYVHQQKIDIMEFDGANIITVYAGPFMDHYVFTAVNDSSKFIILTNLNNPTIAPNLYSISLK